MNTQSMYDPFFDHDGCGVGFVVNINGEKSHSIIEEGITILKNLEHRGAVGGDQQTGDGAGLLLQIPHKFFCKVTDLELPPEDSYGVGFLFLPPDHNERNQAMDLISETVHLEGGTILGWREVPTNPGCLGELARESRPSFWQTFITVDDLKGVDLERKLYLLRKIFEKNAEKKGWDINQFYIPSLSSKKVIYKGMFVSTQFSSFYPDVQDEDFISAFALVHQRYSTNTFPSWPLAQPFRFMAHNGEINTLRGNINKISAGEKTLASRIFGAEINKIVPIINPATSDSAIFDNVLELLTLGGRSIEHSLMMMVPEAFGYRYHISQDKRAFYEYHAAIMDPWDGPAAIAFTDGTKIAACLDRNGLRPCRYLITKSGKVIVASEVGVLDIDPKEVREKGRLGPGKMILVDTELKRFIRDNEIKSRVSRWKPYRRWLEENRIELKGLFQVPRSIGVDLSLLTTKQLAFGYSREDLHTIILPMVKNAQEPVGSMGNDTPPAILSEKPQLLYNYFKQIFAQVTNPPIDPYRENLVMSLMSFVGRQSNLLEETPEHCRQLKLYHPILTNEDIERLRGSHLKGFRVCRVAMLFKAQEGVGALEKGTAKLCAEVEKKVNEGYSLIVISDRDIQDDKAPIPALLAISAVHHHLVRCGKRHLTALIVETGEAREVNHFAMLSSYGASGINPYLVFETLIDLKKEGYIGENLSLQTVTMNYITAVKKGMLKIMSKMGISTIRSYRGAQTYEAIGLSEKFIQRYFPGTTTRIGGIDIKLIEKHALERHAKAFNKKINHGSILETGGFYSYRRFAEKHAFSPDMITLLQKAVRDDDYSVFKCYSSEVNDINKNLCTLRGLFRFKPVNSIPIEEVEPAENIVKRFVTSAMSFGSISKEAHETLAKAMNRLGSRSNSGEGGEDKNRYYSSINGDNINSKIKQVASARFGVDINYLINSEELQIKMAQGAKPGEGGQLPGFKVDEMIAKVRHSTPGAMLISPPPHHDIYSIEDLAQLIYDLKCANPEARVSVKLVSEIGVGTVAAGVAKAKADMVLISGNDGGTGASPLSSIKHAGSYWEIGLAETQQVLVRNKLRHRIRIQVDGGLKTGRDVVIAALLGAEEFGFGTTSLVTLGCILMRKCHLNTCPVGIATQDSKLRKRFQGKPEYVMRYMNFLAQEVREIMAQLAIHSFEEMVGHVDMLQINDAIEHYKGKGLDFSKLLYMTETPPDSALRCIARQNHDFSFSLDDELIKHLELVSNSKKRISINMSIRNCNRAVGAKLSGNVSKMHGPKGLPENTIKVKFIGSAGQSFGAFLAPGITFELEGDANDYLGKGLSGGRIMVYPPRGSTFLAHKNIITGNVNLFGATGGEVYINGMAGERFCVRNSGAVAIVEGVGDHGCEYMTGGRVVVLGKTGVNFAAGMSGGIAYIFDENQLFDTRCNLEMVDIEPVVDVEDTRFLHNVVQKHKKYTRSKLASQMLQNWEEILPYFVKVMPVEYRRALERIKTQVSRDVDFVGMTEEVY